MFCAYRGISFIHAFSYITIQVNSVTNRNSNIFEQIIVILKVTEADQDDSYFCFNRALFTDSRDAIDGVLPAALSLRARRLRR